MWNWFLQEIGHGDFPFDLERVRYYGATQSVRDAVREAHTHVSAAEIEYVYLDRRGTIIA